MSHRVAPCSDFSGEVERVPENGDCGEFQAVLAGVCTEKIQPQIGWLSPAIWLQDKGGWL